MKIYISGAMASDPNFLDKFDLAEAKVRAENLGAEVINPAQAGLKFAKVFEKVYKRLPSPHEYLEADISIIGDCTHYVRIKEDLPSPGSDIEELFARYAGLEIMERIEV